MSDEIVIRCGVNVLRRGEESSGISQGNKENGTMSCELWH